MCEHCFKEVSFFSRLGIQLYPFQIFCQVLFNYISKNSGHTLIKKANREKNCKQMSNKNDYLPTASTHTKWKVEGRSHTGPSGGKLYIIFIQLLFGLLVSCSPSTLCLCSALLAPLDVAFLTSLPTTPQQKYLLLTGDRGGEEEDNTRLNPSWRNEGVGMGRKWVCAADWRPLTEAGKKKRQEKCCGTLTCSLWTIS